MKTTIDLPDLLYDSMVRLAAEDDVPVLDLIASLLARAVPYAREEDGKEGKGKESDDLPDWRAELL